MSTSKLFYTKLVPTWSHVSGSSVAGFEPANLNSQNINRYWQGSGILETDAQTITVERIWVIDSDAVTMSYSVDSGVSYTSMTKYTDSLDRTSFYADVSSAITSKNIRLALDNVPTSFPALTKIGAVYIFQSKLDIARNPTKGYKISDIYPESFRTLANGALVQVSKGEAYKEISFSFTVMDNEDMFQVNRLARTAPVGYDTGISEDRFIVRSITKNVDRIQDTPLSHKLKLQFREVIL